MQYPTERLPRGTGAPWPSMMDGPYSGAVFYRMATIPAAAPATAPEPKLASNHGFMFADGGILALDRYMAEQDRRHKQ